MNWPDNWEQQLLLLLLGEGWGAVIRQIKQWRFG